MVLNPITETQHEGHATEIAKSLDLKNVYAIICVSGDVSILNSISLLYRDCSVR